MEERLKKLRKLLNLSQREFCDKIGLKQSTYASFEAGSRKMKDSYIKLIAQSYKVNESWLKTGAGEVFQDHYSPEALELLQLYNELNGDFKKYLLKTAKALRELHIHSSKIQN